jgi:hypothetical protein
VGLAGIWTAARTPVKLTLLRQTFQKADTQEPSVGLFYAADRRTLKLKRPQPRGDLAGALFPKVHAGGGPKAYNLGSLTAAMFLIAYFTIEDLARDWGARIVPFLGPIRAQIFIAPSESRIMRSR